MGHSLFTGYGSEVTGQQLGRFIHMTCISHYSILLFPSPFTGLHEQDRTQRLQIHHISSSYHRHYPRDATGTATIINIPTSHRRSTALIRPPPPRQPPPSPHHHRRRRRRRRHQHHHQPSFSVINPGVRSPPPSTKTRPNPPAVPGLRPDDPVLS